MDCLRRCDGGKKTTKRGQSPGTCAGVPSTEGQVAGPGAGREKTAMGKGLLWWREGHLWSRDADGLGDPNLPPGLSSIWALPEDKSRVEPGSCRGCRRRWKISSLGGRVVTSDSWGCQESEQRSASPWAGTWNVFSHQEKGQFYAPGITFKLHEFSSYFLVKETLCRIRMILSFLTQTKI